MKHVLTFAFLCITLLSTAQRITISAKVVDKQTREAITFASVGLKGRSISTITNLQGEFDFHIPSEYRNDILVISMLGYENFEAPAWTLLENFSGEIEMTKSTQVLDEVVVSDSLRGGDILVIALTRTEQNYPMNPYLMDGFYRDIKEVAGTYVSLLEAAVKIYDEGYSVPRNKYKLHERVSLLEVRRSLGYSNKFTAYFDEGNLLEDLLLHNNVRYRQFPDNESFFDGLQREKDSYYDGREIFVVTNKRDYTLKIYVDKKTFGIIHLEYENSPGDVIKRRRNVVSKFVSLRRIIDFKLFEGKLYLNYISLDSKINWYEKKTDQLRFETQLHQQLLINQVYPDSEDRISTTQKMRSYGLQYQDMPYNKEFWDNYNVIKETPVDRKVMKDLEKELPLEKQFENN